MYAIMQWEVIYLGIGEVIKQSRKVAGLTQKELGEKVGCAEVTIRQYEANRREPSFEMCRKLEEALQIALVAHIDDFIDVTQKRLSAIKDEENTRFEARMQKLRPKAEAEFNEKVNNFVSSAIGKSIIYIFHELNDLGKDEAEKRLYELAEIPKYQRTEPPEQLEDEEGATNPAEQEKPPESE